LTWGKYRRLLVVLTVPLLLIGGIFAMYVLKGERYAFIRCENAGILAPNCRQTNLGGPLDMMIEKQHPSWFDLKIAEYEANAFPSISASGSQMVLDGAEIVSVEPYMGTDETDGSPVAKLREMAVSREPITIIFGVEEELPRGLDALGCNELDISQAPSTYVAGLCGVPNGVALMTFHPNAEGKAYLEELQRSVTSQAEEAKSQLMWSYLILIPSFLAMFLLGSFLIWIGKRTASYVSAG
jgi:hypothetical protein